ncbi:MAG: polymorphic toxin-type HINT domain-containing protein, partial [Planctomycetaceae bacterium]
VTGTFAHAAADVLDLEIEGLDTPLGCTANHPFWSADRQDFVPASSLTIGEHLRTESGTRRQVTRITPRRGPPVAVFNLEVDDEHVYYVSTAGVLVHNTYPGNAPNSAATRGLKKAFEHIDTVGDSLTARRRASELSGLGDDSVPFISDVGPQTGWNVGRQSKDGLRGWRMDWDPNKGYHINWWDKTGGAKRKDWLNGAIKIDGGAWHDYIELLKHGFGN